MNDSINAFDTFIESIGNVNLRNNYALILARAILVGEELVQPGLGLADGSPNTISKIKEIVDDV